MTNQYDFSNKVVMVTGATGNLGEAVARAYIKSGASLILPDRSEGRMLELFPDLCYSRHHLLVNNIEISSPEEVASLMKEVKYKFKKIDLLVHTIGGYLGGKLPHETTLETWEAMHHMNARITFIINRAVVQMMLDQQYGQIVNIGSISGLSAGPKNIAYAASKADVIRITESLSKAYGNMGIRVNSILPGTIDTPENRKAMPNADYGKWVKPESIAEIILFITSDSGQPINGALIPVTG